MTDGGEQEGWWCVYLKIDEHVYDGYGGDPPDNPMVVWAAGEDEARTKAVEEANCDCRAVDATFEGEELF